MACAPIRTGDRYLQTMIEHIDCQAQTIGGFGYGALSEPGSTMSLALTTILVIFVALFGIRVAMGYPIAGRDMAGHAIRVVIVLVLATSWPAWRIIGYDLIVAGPTEIVQMIVGSANLPGTAGDLVSRLQRVDDGLAILNERGAGRRGVQTGDWFQLGFTRSAFLTGTIGPLGLVRLTGGILLALAPLVAGLLLFGFTRSIFSGWAKALVAVFLSTIAISILLSVELALIEPWLGEVLRIRAANQEALSAPVEGLTLTLAFTLMCFGAIAFSAWIAFNASFASAVFLRTDVARNQWYADNSTHTPAGSGMAQRAQHGPAVAASVARSVERDERLGRADSIDIVRVDNTSNRPAAAANRTIVVQPPEPLGASYRRNAMSGSRASKQRDQVR